MTATVLPPPVARSARIIALDITYATSNLDALAERLKGPRFRAWIVPQMRREMIWLGELLDELEKAP